MLRFIVATPDFYNQHKVASFHSDSQERMPSAPANHKAPSTANYRPSSMGNHIPVSSKKLESKPQRHWITWDSGTPEPPGRQKRLHRPWPTPEPVLIDDSNRPVSSLSRPGNPYIMPVRPTQPVPDMLGSDGIHPSLTRDREECFSPKPPNLPVRVKHGGKYPLNVYL